MNATLTVENKLYNNSRVERACSMDPTKLSKKERIQRIMSFTMDEVSEMIAKTHNISIDDARLLFKSSGTYKSLFKSRTELWGESSEHIFECFEIEIQNVNIKYNNM